jgi:hypothetical protein
MVAMSAGSRCGPIGSAIEWSLIFWALAKAPATGGYFAR